MMKLTPELTALHRLWAPIVGLGEWRDYSYIAGEDDGETWAWVESSQWEYKKFKVCYFPCVLTLGPDDLEWTVVHEMMHVVESGRREILDQILDHVNLDEKQAERLIDVYEWHDERLTTELADALIRAFNAGRSWAVDSGKPVALDSATPTNQKPTTEV